MLPLDNLAQRFLTFSSDILTEIRSKDKILTDLRVTDPRDDKSRIEEAKGGLLKNSYYWIFDNADFRQ